MKVLQVYDMLQRGNKRIICKVLSKYEKNLEKERTMCLFKATLCLLKRNMHFSKGLLGCTDRQGS